jgi:biotin operon repressor
MSIPHVSTTLADLAEEIGFAPAILLSGAYGGINIYIPNKIAQNHNLAKLLIEGGCGMGAVMTLEQLYGGQTINISPLTVYEELRKMSLMLSLQAQGHSLKDIAKTLSLSQATVKTKLEKGKDIGITVRKIRHKKRLKGSAIQAIDNTFNPQTHSAKDRQADNAQQGLAL